MDSLVSSALSCGWYCSVKGTDGDPEEVGGLVAWSEYVRGCFAVADDPRLEFPSNVL